MKITDRVKMNLIIAHHEEAKWFQDEIAKIEAQNAKDLEVVNYMQSVRPLWAVGSPADRKAKYAKVMAEYLEEVG